MVSSRLVMVAAGALFGTTFAAPAPQPDATTAAAPTPAPTAPPAAAELEERQLLGALGSAVSAINSIITGNANPTSLASVLSNLTPTTRPTDIAQVQSTVSSIFSTTPTNIYANAATMVVNGLKPTNLVTILNEVGENSVTNVNPAPPYKIYPKKNSTDAPYSLTEEQLRAAIYIPSTFTYGKKPSTLMIPGTGSFGGATFAANIRKLLTGVSYADPVWLNVPGALLGDAQVNAEYVAYFINYISAISGNATDMSVISWSQGGLITQWAFKYWPSTRKPVADFLPVSPDFHGTVLADALCLSGTSSAGADPCDPAVIQQEYTSAFVTTLRRNGGDSAYVPTTTMYSGFFDEVVEPQQGTGASAYLLDARNVGVTNNQAQLICPNQPAGGFYSHEGMLYNPVAFALIVDALTHDGPGQASRISSSVCQEIAATGLTLDDVIATEGLVPMAAINLLLFVPKMTNELPLMSYAAAA